MKDNNTEIYSTYNEGKSVVAERFIRTLKNKINKHMVHEPKNVYFDMLDNIVDKYKNRYYSHIKIKPIHAESGSYTE